MLSMRSKYALRACLALAQESPGHSILIADLAKKAQLPRKYLEAILLELRHGGFLTSRKGRGGGYLLSKPPAMISVGQIVQATDSPLVPSPCASRPESSLCSGCETDSGCGIQQIMSEVFQAANIILDRTSLQDILDRESEVLQCYSNHSPAGL